MTAPTPVRALRVLHIEDSEADHELAMAHLRRGGARIEAHRVDTESAFRSALTERIDLVFTLGRPALVLDMQRLGLGLGDKTRPPGHGGLWPSDHAALAALLVFFD